MTARTVLADMLLALSVLVVLGSSLGVLLMRDVYDKLHYVTPAALVAPVLAGLAVLAQSGFDVNTGQTLLTVVFLAIATPFLSHATVRAIRIRQEGDWRGAGEHQDDSGRDDP